MSKSQKKSTGRFFYIKTRQYAKFQHIWTKKKIWTKKPSLGSFLDGALLLGYYTVKSNKVEISAASCMRTHRDQVSTSITKRNYRNKRINDGVRRGVIPDGHPSKN